MLVHIRADRGLCNLLEYSTILICIDNGWFRPGRGWDGFVLVLVYLLSPPAAGDRRGRWGWGCLTQAPLSPADIWNQMKIKEMNRKESNEMTVEKNKSEQYVMSYPGGVPTTTINRIKWNLNTLPIATSWLVDYTGWLLTYLHAHAHTSFLHYTPPLDTKNKRTWRQEYCLFPGLLNLARGVVTCP